MALKLSYTPEQGMYTRYYNVDDAIAPDGSKWRSVGNRWEKVEASPAERLRPPSNSAAPLYALFGFFVAMAIFAKPVGMSFPDMSVGLPVLLVICAICAAVFYRIAR